MCFGTVMVEKCKVVELVLYNRNSIITITKTALAVTFDTLFPAIVAHLPRKRADTFSVI
jgi:hypothetical protein